MHVGSGRLLRSFDVDGGLRRRTQLAVAEISALAASADGTVYVLDARRRKLMGLSPATGEVTVTFDFPRSIRTPSDITCDGYGTVYLLDGRARNIHVLRPAGEGE